MADLLDGTPLIALDAVVLDTETTGLDITHARIIQIGAVRIRNGVIGDETFEELVNPGIAVPAESTQVHGITTAMVAGRMDFAEAFDAFRRFAGDAVLVGHSIGFDLAILKRECALAELAWRVPRHLDTRLLAEAAKTDLPGFSIETLANWLDVEVVGRHSALGDALTTARLFLALAPRLRAAGLRTLAEAERAAAERVERLQPASVNGWVMPEAPQSRLDSERTLARIDSYPYRHRVADVMKDPVFVADDMSLGEAMRIMTSRRISSVLTAAAPDAGAGLAADGAGIVTERDVLWAIDADGAKALAKPVSAYASTPLHRVREDAFIYRALGRMERLGIRHLTAIDEHDRVTGSLSARDLLRLRASDAISLGDAIDHAESVADLASAWARIPAVASSLLKEGVEARGVANVISREIGAVTRQAAIMAAAQMARDNRGEPPTAFAVVILGSGGRGESLLAADQDNAVVFEDGAPGSSQDLWFAEFGEHVAEILDTVGLPFCRGGVMLKNAAWRGSLATWRDRVENWVRNSRPQDLLNVDIFFDMRAVRGKAALANRLLEEAFALGHGVPEFAKLLGEVTTTTHLPLTMWGGIRTEDGRVDLKKGALFPIVGVARCLAIRHNIARRATSDRLEGLRALDIGAPDDIANLVEVHELILGHILRQQLDDLAAGRRLTNTVLLARLSKPQQRRLKQALNSLGDVNDMVRNLMFAKPRSG